ncbi:MAG TPA: LptE family protein [Elusimicrobiota bacterium]|nr:LptE family protein [Elusimicrobiota bacterium]
MPAYRLNGVTVKQHHQRIHQRINSPILRYAVTSLLFLSFAGCGKYYYNPALATVVLPQYIRKIAVRPFANHTQQYGLEDKLTVAVQNEFNLDGRYSITTEEQADGVLIGDIAKYILEPLSYDSNHVPTQYKLWILVNITFYDKVHNQSLWTEPNMSGQLIYYAASSALPGAMTEEEARETIWDQLSRDIRTRTFEGFGTVTGTSEKAVPQSNPDLYNTESPLPPTGQSNPPPPPTTPYQPSPGLTAPY